MQGARRSRRRNGWRRVSNWRNLGCHLLLEHALLLCCPALWVKELKSHRTTKGKGKKAKADEPHPLSLHFGHWKAGRWTLTDLAEWRLRRPLLSAKGKAVRRPDHCRRDSGEVTEPWKDWESGCKVTFEGSGKRQVTQDRRTDGNGMEIWFWAFLYNPEQTGGPLLPPCCRILEMCSGRREPERLQMRGSRQISGRWGALWETGGC